MRTRVDHEWLLRMLAHRTADRRVLRLIERWLKAGILESGRWQATETGTPQGSGISPLLANVFLHYVFDLWVHQWRRRHLECLLWVYHRISTTDENRPSAPASPRNVP